MGCDGLITDYPNRAKGLKEVMQQYFISLKQKKQNQRA
jgi:hypothetical protein